MQSIINWCTIHTQNYKIERFKITKKIHILLLYFRKKIIIEFSIKIKKIRISWEKMLTYGIVVPSLLLLATFAFEYVAFLTSHMIDSRSLASLHVGIFLRCSYPITIGNRNEFRCLWWSDDTFNHDESKIFILICIITWLGRWNLWKMVSIFMRHCLFQMNFYLKRFVPFGKIIFVIRDSNSIFLWVPVPGSYEVKYHFHIKWQNL